MFRVLPVYISSHFCVLIPGAAQTAEQKRFLMSFLPTDPETLDSLNNFSKAWMFGRKENGTKKDKTQSV